MEFFVSTLLFGISVGGQYALIAIGYTMVYGILRLITFAHGDVFMVAGLLGIYLSSFLSAYLPPAAVIPVSLLLVLALTVALGFCIERAAYKPLRSAPRMSVMISAIGVSYLLQNSATYITGGQPMTYPSIPFLSDTISLAGTSIKWVVILTPFLVAALVLVLTQLINHTKVGMAMRAVAKDFETSQLMGIKINSVISVTFVIGSALAAVGSMLYFTTYPAIVPTAGAMPGLKAFVAAVFGGIGSISGSCLATFLYVACAEWWLRFLDSPMTFTSVTDTRRILFILVFAALVIGGALLLIRRERRTTKKVWKELLVSLAALALLVWLAFFIISGSLTVPLLRTGFRMVVFSVIIMIVVLFFRRGIMGDKEFSDILFARRKASGKGAVK